MAAECDNRVLSASANAAPADASGQGEVLRSDQRFRFRRRLHLGTSIGR